MTNDKTAALAVDGLTKRYPGFTLDGVSFRLEPGKILGLVGKNGAGKSTLLKSILRAVRPDAGRVEIFGKSVATENVRGESAALRGRGGVFFRSQRKNPIPDSDFAAREAETSVKSELGVVLGGIDFYLQKRVSEITGATRRFFPNWDETRYRSLLKQFEIDPKKRVKELSSGMRVKYLVALALSHGARLFLFDEPTSGLDPVSRDEILELFRAIVKDGDRAILFSTHITSDLEKCADSIAYLAGGKLIAAAPKAEFPKRFAHLRSPGEPDLSIEEIMIRTEKKHYDLGASL